MNGALSLSECTVKVMNRSAATIEIITLTHKNIITIIIIYK